MTGDRSRLLSAAARRSLGCLLALESSPDAAAAALRAGAPLGAGDAGRELLAALDAHGLAPWAHEALGRAGLREALAPELADRLRDRYRETALRNRVLFASLAEIAAALTGRGVELIPLKGAALAHRVYGNPGLRPMQDLDLLVRAGRRRCGRRGAARGRVRGAPPPGRGGRAAGALPPRLRPALAGRQGRAALESRRGGVPPGFSAGAPVGALAGRGGRHALARSGDGAGRGRDARLETRLPQPGAGRGRAAAPAALRTALRQSSALAARPAPPDARRRRVPRRLPRACAGVGGGGRARRRGRASRRQPSAGSRAGEAPGRASRMPRPPAPPS